MCRGVGQKKDGDAVFGFVFSYVSLFLNWALYPLNALASWSGQEVPPRHCMPLSADIISSMFLPTVRREIPWRLPLQPPTNLTSVKIPSLTSKIISLEQVPLVRYEYIIPPILKACREWAQMFPTPFPSNFWRYTLPSACRLLWGEVP